MSKTINITVSTGVGGHFSAAHRDRTTGLLHGHTWEVLAWFKQGDAVELQAALNAELAALDHCELPDHLAWSEAIAEHLLQRLKCLEVQVNRPLERLYAKAIAQ
jgi:6-pyruvoyl-tetrahydropterin synthase